jgi:putative intracellular protease/amidase
MNSIARKIIVFLIFTLICMPDMYSQGKDQKNEITFICGPCGCVDDGKYFAKPGLCPSCGMELYASYKGDTDTVQRPISHEEHRRHGKKVAILIFPGAEIIDFAAPWEIFIQAMMNVYTVAAKDTVIDAMGMRLLPDYTFDNSPKPDILLLPGGNVDYNNKEVMDWIKKTALETETVLSVCSGAFFLAAAGLLDGKEATTFLPLIPSLQQLAPKAKVISNKRYVDNGKIVTSAGLSSGIDATLYVISKYLGVGRTQEIATHLEYNWDPEARYVRGLLADKHLGSVRGVFSPYRTQTLLYAGDQTKWEIKLSVTTAMPENKLARLIEFQLAEGKGWKKVSTKENNSNWSFTDNGKQWKGSVTMQTSSTDPQNKIIRLLVWKTK